MINELVGPFQLALIPGRQLADSTVVCGKIVAAWEQKGTEGFMWKVDFAKPMTLWIGPSCGRL